MKDILLACAAGMSTSMLVEKMKKAAIERQISVEISAVSINSIDEDYEHPNLGCVLVGPQARYGLPAVEDWAETHDVPCSLIDPDLYGTFNGDKLLDFAIEVMNG